MHSGNNTDETINSEHVNKINHRVLTVDKKLKDIHFNEKMLMRKLEGHYECTFYR